MSGKPTSGPLHDKLKDCKRIFRRELRAAARKYELDEFETTERTSELDLATFWKILNAKKSSATKRSGNVLVFDGQQAHSTDEILQGWHSYFSNLYSFSEDSRYNTEFKQETQEMVDSFLKLDANNEYSVLGSNQITVEELQKLINALPNNKSGSIDNLTYEHLKHGGERLTSAVCVLLIQ